MMLSACAEALAISSSRSLMMRRDFLGVAHADLVEDVEEDIRLDDLELGVLSKRRFGLFDDALELIDQALDPLARKVIASHPVSFQRLQLIDYTTTLRILE